MAIQPKLVKDWCNILRLIATAHQLLCFPDNCCKTFHHFTAWPRLHCYPVWYSDRTMSSCLLCSPGIHQYNTTWWCVTQTHLANEDVISQPNQTNPKCEALNYGASFGNEIVCILTNKSFDQTYVNKYVWNRVKATCEYLCLSWLIGTNTNWDDEGWLKMCNMQIEAFSKEGLDQSNQQASTPACHLWLYIFKFINEYNSILLLSVTLYFPIYHSTIVLCLCFDSMCICWLQYSD